MNRLKKVSFIAISMKRYSTRELYLGHRKVEISTRVIYPKPQSFIESRGFSHGNTRSGSSLSSTEETADILFEIEVL
jgi:hypothetical protein